MPPRVESWMAVGPDYDAAQREVVVVDRPERRFLRVSGRAPGEMLKGILTGRIPRHPTSAPGGMARGEAAYSALLTAKGKMVSDLRLLGDRDGSFLLDLPAAGFPGTLEHLRKFLPPRLARTSDSSLSLGVLTVVGPGSSALLVREVLAPLPGTESLAALEEGDALFTSLPGGEEVVVLRNDDVLPPALDLLLPPPRRDEIRTRLVAAGARPASPSTWGVLQVERGRPAFGVDMDQETIPVEAGIHTRAVDYGKGCYVGQEVIIRLRDRGQVHRRLLGLLLGDAPLPSRGEELFRQEGGKPVGWITRAVFSPAFGEGAALGYLRREVAVGQEVRVGGPGGFPARVVALGEDGWLRG